MTDESILEETWSILKAMLGLQKKQKPLLKPRPLKPLGPKATQQLTAMMGNYFTNQQLGEPGAMILDTPLSKKRTEKELMEDFERTQVTQRDDGITIQDSDLPRGTLTSRAIGRKP